MHAVTCANVPNGVLFAILTCPAPLQVSHVSYSPLSLPVPSQFSHSVNFSTCISFCVPNTASSKSRYISYLKSLPLFCLFLPPPPKNISNGSPPNTSPKISFTSNPLNISSCEYLCWNPDSPYWSYCVFFVSSLNTAYASEIFLNFSDAPSSLLTSG